MKTDWTNEQFSRLEKRLKTFKESPEKLTPLVRKKCAELHDEIKRDSYTIELAISAGIDIKTLPNENPKRAALVEWLASEVDHEQS